MYLSKKKKSKVPTLEEVIVFKIIVEKKIGM